MDTLADVTVADLQRALAAVDGKKPALRLVAAIAYKNGVTQTDLARWFDVERKTIYNWLTRLDAEDLAGSAQDDPRPGRPRKLPPAALARLRTTLERPPADAGYGARAWTPRLVQRHVRAAFGVAYSLPTCRRLLQEAQQ